MWDVSLRHKAPLSGAVLIVISGLLLLWQSAGWLSAMFWLINLAATVWLLRCSIQVTPATVSDTQTAHVMPAPQAAQDHLPDLLGHVLPVWTEHLDQVRQQSDQAIGQLIQSCSAMVTAFDNAGFATAGADTSTQQSTSITLLQLCKKELNPLIFSLQQVINSKDELLGCMRQLAEATRELNSMTSEVGQIAATTNLLAINAAIEAARVGEHGRGFAVVAGEVRKLSHQSAETGRRMSERVKRIADVMQSSLKTADRAALNDSKVLEVSGEVIKDVLSHVTEMADTSESMRIQGQIIRENFEELMVSLQFQDRISQILQVVHGDIARLNHEIGEVPQDMSDYTRDWLEVLKSTYTMQEELNAHNGQPAEKTSTEITFF